MRHLPRLIGRRMIQVIPVILLATVVVFGLQQLMPGDPAIILAGESPTPAHIQEVRHYYGLDKPLVVQYATWLSRAAQGNLSRSLLTGTDVVKLIEDRMPATLLIACCALALAVVTGVPLGIAAAVRPGSLLDRFVSALASLGVALPTFWISMILVTIFALRLNWFPATGDRVADDASRRCIAPCRTAGHSPRGRVAGGGGPAVAQCADRCAVLAIYPDPARQGPVIDGDPLAAWIEECQRHPGDGDRPDGESAARRNGGDRSGVRRTGIGSLIADSARNNDFVVIQGVVLVMVFAVICINLTVDVVCSLLDPRISQK